MRSGGTAGLSFDADGIIKNHISVAASDRGPLVGMRWPITVVGALGSAGVMTRSGEGCEVEGPTPESGATTTGAVPVSPSAAPAFCFVVLRFFLG